VRKLPRAAQVRIVRTIQALSVDGDRGDRKLAGQDDVFRVRVRRYRVLYSLEYRRPVIIVLKVGDRKDVYRQRVLLVPTIECRYQAVDHVSSWLADGGSVGPLHHAICDMPGSHEMGRKP
jgi:mRNA interferase RelE/StbE